jgi:rhodanese-related sulfurtransferase
MPAISELTPQQLKNRLGADTPVLLDVREDGEFAIAHLPDSLHIPMRQVPERVAEIDRDRPVVVICHHGARSMQVARFLQNQGFADVSNLAGGIDAWAQTVDPNMPRY